VETQAGRGREKESMAENLSRGGERWQKMETKRPRGSQGVGYGGTIVAKGW